MPQLVDNMKITAQNKVYCNPNSHRKKNNRFKLRYTPYSNCWHSLSTSDYQLISIVKGKSRAVKMTNN